MAKDIFYETVKQGLIKEGWTITADPLRLTYEDERFEPDLAAERVYHTKNAEIVQWIK